MKFQFPKLMKLFSLAMDAPPAGHGWNRRQLQALIRSMFSKEESELTDSEIDQVITYFGSLIP